MINSDFLQKLILLLGLLVSGMSCSDEPNLSCSGEPNSIFIGTWNVVSVSNLYFQHPYCEKLENGSRFIFDCNSRVFIYNRNNPNPCTNTKHYYANKDSTIEMWEGDMLFYYDILFFNGDTLKIKRFEDLTLVKEKI